jgi:hypothetical protein
LPQLEKVVCKFISGLSSEIIKSVCGVNYIEL